MNESGGKRGGYDGRGAFSGDGGRGGGVDAEVTEADVEVVIIVEMGKRESLVVGEWLVRRLNQGYIGNFKCRHTLIIRMVWVFVTSKISFGVHIYKRSKINALRGHSSRE